MLLARLHSVEGTWRRDLTVFQQQLSERRLRIIWPAPLRQRLMPVENLNHLEFVAIIALIPVVPG